MMDKIKIRFITSGVLIFIFLLGSFFWWHQATSSVDPKNTTPSMFVVSKGEGVRSVANRLKSQGLIRDSIAFFLMVRALGIDNDIQAGDFRLNPSMDTKTIAQELTHGVLDVWVTTLEGWRVEEIALELAQTLQIPESEFLQYAKEGYMFPDTYLIPNTATASAIAKMFEDNFFERFDKNLQARVQKQGLTLNEAITLASIVEREARFDTDRPIIAGILLKRLKKGWPLDVDASIQYALGYQPEEKSWWKENLTANDLQIKSPYNTRKVKGLPPGPICNPGLASLTAVVEPQKTNYWFYLSDSTGKMHYAKTLEEHEENIAKYLR